MQAGADWRTEKEGYGSTSIFCHSFRVQYHTDGGTDACQDSELFVEIHGCHPSANTHS